MRYRKLDSNGDYVCGKGNLGFYKDEPNAVGQAAHTRLGLLKGEWFLDITIGVPYLEKVLGKQHRQDYDFPLREAILNTPGVIALDRFHGVIAPDTNKLMVFGVLTTVYGTATLQHNGQ